MTYQGVIDQDFVDHRARMATACRDALDEIDKKLKRYEDKGVLKLWQMQDADRLKTIRSEIQKTLNELQGIIEIETTQAIKTAYETAGMWTGYVIENTVGAANYTFAGINRYLLEASVSRKIAGLTVSDRLSAARLGLLWKERDAVARAQLMGYGAEKTARQVILADVEASVKTSFSRAMMIGRTETTRNTTEATNAANDDARGEGIDTRLKWVSAHDERTRLSHRKLDGTVAGHWSEELGQYVFMVGGSPSAGPGHCAKLSDNVNCRCRAVTICMGYAEFYPSYESYYQWLDRAGKDPAQKALVEKVMNGEAA